MPDVRAWGRGRVVAAGVLLPAALLALAGIVPPAQSARAAGGPDAGRRERVPAFDAVLVINPDGTVRVKETITYDFDEGGQHGVDRRVRYRRGDRLFEIRDVRTSSSTGAPARAKTTRLLHDVRISVGDRRQKVHGRQAYVIEYEVDGAFTPKAGHDELAWDAVGDSWDVPIDEAAVRVESPVPLRKAGCRAGRPPATTPCLRDRDGPYAIDFTQRGLRPGEGMTVRVKLPKGVISVPPPRRAPPRWAGTWHGTAALVLALGSVVLASRRPVAPRRAGTALVGAGTVLAAADAADDVLARGPWGFSLGDGCLAGCALAIMGAAILCAHRLRNPTGHDSQQDGLTVGRTTREQHHRLKGTSASSDARSSAILERDHPTGNYGP